MNLIHIHFIGADYLNNNIYEFLFSSNPQDAWGENWDAQPANGNPEPPQDVEKIGLIKTDLKFELALDSETFDMMDCKEQIIALGWEDVLDYDEAIEDRLVFAFGETLESVENKFYARDLELKYKKELEYV